MEKQIFKVGDKVFVYGLGWGKIVHLKFKTACITFSDNHYDCRKIYYEFISFTEYTLEGFSQERPCNWEDYIGKWGKFWDDGDKSFVIGKLSSLDGSVFHIKNFGFFDNFKPLTEEQIKILGLED